MIDDSVIRAALTARIQRDGLAATARALDADPDLVARVTAGGGRRGSLLMLAEKLGLFGPVNLAISTLPTMMA